MTTSDVLRERPIERASDRIDEQCQFTQVRHVAMAALVEMRRAHNMMHSNAGYCAPIVISAQDLQRAAALLNASECVARMQS